MGLMHFYTVVSLSAQATPANVWVMGTGFWNNSAFWDNEGFWKN